VKLDAWLKTHKQEAILGGGGIAITVILYLRSRSKSTATPSSSSSPSANGAVPTVAYPTSTANTTGTDAISGLESQILGLQTAVLNLKTQPQSAPAGQTQTAPQASQPTTGSGQAFGDAYMGQMGFGQTQFNGQSYIDLGTVGPGSFFGYNVGNSGAPIYYLTPSGQLSTNDSPQMLASLPPGTLELTDTQAPVSKTPGKMSFP
jgi:hypothetical protein